MSRKFRIALFASGSGSNAEQIIHHFSGHEMIEVVSIFSNKEKAFVHDRAKRLSVPSYSFTRNAMYKTDEVLDQLHAQAIDYVILAGFLWLMPPNLIAAFENRIINIHPALLPKYGGKGMYGQHVHEAVVANKEEETGITIHLVNEEYDKGRILHQSTCKVLTSDTAEQVAEKIHLLEYKYFPQVIEDYILKKEFKSLS